MFNTIVARTLRVPSALQGKASTEKQVATARSLTVKLDGALMKSGFKMSSDLFFYLASQDPFELMDFSRRLIAAVEPLLGNHVKHNPYFKSFPDKVPDTSDFWAFLISESMKNDESKRAVLLDLSMGFLNLLNLRGYGQVQHSYEEMLAAHEPLVDNAKTAGLKILSLGGSLSEGVTRLFSMLAKSQVPLSEEDLKLIREIGATWAESVSDDDVEVFGSMPIRENRAIANAALVRAGKAVSVDTVTDILRLSVELCGGDVTLETSTKFKKIPRAYRRSIMRAIELLLREDNHKMEDVFRHRETWKRLGERVHPHEGKAYPLAQKLFAVARGDLKLETLSGRIQNLLLGGEYNVAARLLALMPGSLFRSLDNLLRNGADPSLVLKLVQETAPRVSGRVLLSVMEHFMNRNLTTEKRVFPTRNGKLWIQDEDRTEIGAVAKDLIRVIEEEIVRRLPVCSDLVVEDDVREVALPLSDKNKPKGITVLPRGSVVPVSTGKKTNLTLRFFCYWKQKADRTDYDLSCLLLNKDLHVAGYCAFTNLSGAVFRHSGDITSAPNGATEFIDVDLSKVLKEHRGVKYIVPQVNVYSGESFDEVEEAFFGFMLRDPSEKGAPFEPSTVRMKCDIRGKGKVALPIAFYQDGNVWKACWLNSVLPGQPSFNMVEGNHMNTSLLASAVVNRKRVTVGYLTDLIRRKSEDGHENTVEGRVYVGLHNPPHSEEGTTVYNSTNFIELIPA